MSVIKNTGRKITENVFFLIKIKTKSISCEGRNFLKQDLIFSHLKVLHIGSRNNDNDNDDGALIEKSISVLRGSSDWSNGQLHDGTSFVSYHVAKYYDKLRFCGNGFAIVLSTTFDNYPAIKYLINSSPSINPEHLIMPFYMVSMSPSLTHIV